jgi:hypothetical protein
MVLLTWRLTTLLWWVLDIQESLFTASCLVYSWGIAPSRPKFYPTKVPSSDGAPRSGIASAPALGGGLLKNRDAVCVAPYPCIFSPYACAGRSLVLYALGCAEVFLRRENVAS